VVGAFHDAVTRPVSISGSETKSLEESDISRCSRQRIVEALEAAFEQFHEIAADFSGSRIVKENK
jgi:hypothetical protein